MNTNTANPAVKTTYRLKYNNDQYQHFAEGEDALAVEVARTVRGRDTTAVLYREDTTGCHIVSLDLPKPKAEKPVKQAKPPKFVKSVESVDELFTPIPKNPGRSRRKSVAKATAV